MNFFLRHLTRPKIRFPTYLAYQNMSFSHISYIRQRIGQNFMQISEMCRKFALSYRFPTCTNPNFLSSVCSPCDNW